MAAIATTTLLLLSGATGLSVTRTVHRPQGLRLLPRRAGRVCLGWGPEPVWTKLQIASIRGEAQGQMVIAIDPPSETKDGYLTPGQYVQMRELDVQKASFYAIASAPGAVPFEFLIKEQPPSEWSAGTGWLTSASAGTEVMMSQAMGTGFKSVGDSPSVLLFAAGSGIAPIRSVIESGVLKGKDVTLYYGAQTLAQMAYKDKFDEWTKLGVECVPVISKPADDWNGATGYVQDVARARGVPAESAMLICGMKGMAEGVKALAADSGVPEDKVIANF
jgi:NAD(P)H-flavin reductase